MPIEIDFSQNAFVKWGEERGEAKGEAKLLTRMIERRFGPLPESAKARIQAAKHRWSQGDACDDFANDGWLAEKAKELPKQPTERDNGGQR